MLLRSGPRALAGLLLCGAVLLTGCASTSTTTPAARTATSAGARPAASDRATSSVPSWVGSLPTVLLSRLPAEARHTVTLIDRGGPFPYVADGAVFRNFERHLPLHPRGYYHEYTVRTPGRDDRGARRFVTGQGSELYYTDDHYNSFKAVLK
ncbi:ribonuclease domain-containing protein [Streptomyces sp. NPDC046805]|uniref:ribonuclease domain-containing protein n=1 Tax=Streptomyces sp. NPDC046805 TaxID=3155134 RepID=UPI0033E1BC17